MLLSIRSARRERTNSNRTHSLICLHGGFFADSVRRMISFSAGWRNSLFITWCLEEMVTCRDGLALLLRLRLVMNGVRLMAETKWVERDDEGRSGRQYDSISITPERGSMDSRKGEEEHENRTKLVNDARRLGDRKRNEAFEWKGRILWEWKVLVSHETSVRWNRRDKDRNQLNKQQRRDSTYPRSFDMPWAIDYRYFESVSSTPVSLWTSAILSDWFVRPTIVRFESVAWPRSRWNYSNDWNTSISADVSSGSSWSMEDKRYSSWKWVGNESLLGLMCRRNECSSLGRIRVASRDWFEIEWCFRITEEEYHLRRNSIRWHWRRLILVRLDFDAIELLSRFPRSDVNRDRNARIDRCWSNEGNSTVPSALHRHRFGQIQEKHSQTDLCHRRTRSRDQSTKDARQPSDPTDNWKDPRISEEKEVCRRQLTRFVQSHYRIPEGICVYSEEYPRWSGICPEPVRVERRRRTWFSLVLKSIRNNVRLGCWNWTNSLLHSVSTGSFEFGCVDCHRRTITSLVSREVCRVRDLSQENL